VRVGRVRVLNKSSERTTTTTTASAIHQFDTNLPIYLLGQASKTDQYIIFHTKSQQHEYTLNKFANMDAKVAASLRNTPGLVSK